MSETDSDYWDKVATVRRRRKRWTYRPSFLGDPEPDEVGAMPGYVRWALDNRAGKFTPAQREALELTYGRGLSQYKAADIAGCTRSAYRKRLAGAERALRIVLSAEARIDGKRPSEVRRGRNAGRAAL